MLSLDPTWREDNADSTDLSFELHMGIVSCAERETQTDRCFSILIKTQHSGTKIFIGLKRRQRIDSDDP